MGTKMPSQKNQTHKRSLDEAWPLINHHAAGVDIGSREHWACVVSETGTPLVRQFGTFTADLEALACWFKEHGVTSVAMEATGVYWIPLFQVLEREGFQVLLANARQTKNVSGRKTDVQDCQWIQRLHTYGLLQGSFRPADAYCVLRSYLRHREGLVSARGTQCQLIQKVLQQMNLQLTQVLSDVTGLSGLNILRAIVAGERDAAQLARLVDRRVRAKPEAIQAALQGDYRPEHLFVLQQLVEMYDVYEGKIQACNEQLVQELARLANRVDPVIRPLPDRKPGRGAYLDKLAGQDMRAELYCKLGVDLTAIEGVGIETALTILTEVGADVSRFPSEKHFASWLGLCPDNRISGGQVLSSRTRRVVNRVSDALRMAANSLERSQSALGGYFRQMKARVGAAEAITAAAHKLARIIYRMLKHGEEYVRVGMEAAEEKFRARKLRVLQKMAKQMGFNLVETQHVPSTVS